MSSRKRPGGLTALAVINFVMAGWGCLNLLGSLVIVGFAGELKQHAQTEMDRRVFDALGEISMPIWALTMVGYALSVILLIVAGVGYLKTRRWGRRIGNVYAVIGILTVLPAVFGMPAEVGGGFGIGAILGLVYPLLTLLLVNMTFKDDLTTSKGA